MKTSFSLALSGAGTEALISDGCVLRAQSSDKKYEVKVKEENRPRLQILNPNFIFSSLARCGPERAPRFPWVHVALRGPRSTEFPCNPQTQYELSHIPLHPTELSRFPNTIDCRELFEVYIISRFFNESWSFLCACEAMFGSCSISLLDIN